MGTIDRYGRYRQNDPHDQFRSFVWFVCVFAIAYFFANALSGCGSAPTVKEDAASSRPVEVIRHSQKVTVNGQVYPGLGVLPIANRYEIKVFPDDKIERIVWGSCHQQQTVDRPAAGWFDKSFTFIFVPTEGIEDSSSCALEISVLTKDTRYNEALFEFKDRRPEVSLLAYQKCNDWQGYNRGVGICQAAAGLRQTITFEEPALVPNVAGCSPMKASADLKTYSYDIAPGECAYYFTAQTRAENGKRKLFRLKTLGYTKVP